MEHLRLGAVVGLGAVESDDLVADDVVAGLEPGGDLDLRGEVLLDQRVRHPVVAPEIGGLVELGEAESGRRCAGESWLALSASPSQECPLRNAIVRTYKTPERGS